MSHPCGFGITFVHLSIIEAGQFGLSILSLSRLYFDVYRGEFQDVDVGACKPQGR